MNMLPSTQSYLRRLGIGLFLAVLLSAQIVLDTPSVARADVPPGCVELVRNGSFEILSTDWVANASANPVPVYDTGFKLDGLQSLRLGVMNAGNSPGKSAVSQEITLPVDAVSIMLTYRFYMLYSGTADGDVQYVDVNNVATNESVRLINEASSSTQWRMDQRPLTDRRGQTIRLTFGVDNNGGTGRAGMYVDAVSIVSCTSLPATSTFTPTPTSIIPTATATQTPVPPTATSTVVAATPIACDGAELLLNGGFENHDAWTFGEDPIPGQYVNSQRHSGNQSVLLGNFPGYGIPDQVSYSSVRQLVTIPANATSAQLRWWHYYGTQDADHLHQPCQQVVLLSPDLKTLRVIRNVHSNESGWNEDAADLSDLRGQSFYVYFNAYNNGDGQRTWMYIDDVSVRACFPAVESQAIAPVVPSGPIPTAIPLGSAAGVPVAQAPVFEAQPTPFVAEFPTATGLPAEFAPLSTATEVAIAPAASQSLPQADGGGSGNLQGGMGAVVITPTPSSGSFWSNWFGGSSPSSEPSAVTGYERLGTVAVLLGILVIIFLLASAIIRMLSGRR